MQLKELLDISDRRRAALFKFNIRVKSVIVLALGASEMLLAFEKLTISNCTQNHLITCTNSLAKGWTQAIMLTYTTCSWVNLYCSTSNSQDSCAEMSRQLSKWSNNFFIALLGYYRQCVYWNLGHPHNGIQYDDRPETIDSHIFKSSQSNFLFSNPASQMSGTKQRNLNLLVITVSLIKLFVILHDWIVLYIERFNW